MDFNNQHDEKMTSTVTTQKIGIGVKILLSVIVLGSLAAGVYAAIALSR